MLGAAIRAVTGRALRAYTPGVIGAGAGSSVAWGSSAEPETWAASGSGSGEPAVSRLGVASAEESAITYWSRRLASWMSTLPG